MDGGSSGIPQFNGICLREHGGDPALSKFQVAREELGSQQSEIYLSFLNSICLSGHRQSRGSRALSRV
jgi:hypothetical protein